MWSRLKELLVQSDHSSVGNPVMHDLLVRPEDFAIDYNSWILNGAKDETLGLLLSNYTSYANGGKVDRSIAFLDTPSKKGFVIYLTDKLAQFQQPEFLMDHFRDRVSELGYTLYTSDLKVYSKGDYVETQQRHYLKPPMNFVPNKKLSQLFGNISIEYILRDDKPYIFKFSATTYQDHMFEDAKAFELLMVTLFQDSSN